MEQELHLAIAGIKEIAFEIDDSIDFPDIETVGINFEQLLTPNLEESTLGLFLTFRFFIQGKEDTPFLKIKTFNNYMVQELKSFSTETENVYNFPDVLLVTILGLSVSHTRALLAKCTQGTKYDGFFIPIVNPSELAKQLFGINSK